MASQDSPTTAPTREEAQESTPGCEPAAPQQNTTSADPAHPEREASEPDEDGQETEQIAEGDRPHVPGRKSKEKPKVISAGDKVKYVGAGGLISRAHVYVVSDRDGSYCYLDYKDTGAAVVDASGGEVLVWEGDLRPVGK